MTVDTASGGGEGSALPPDAEESTLGVAFFDLSRLCVWASAESDARVASFLQRFYELSAACLEPAGARIVKFMGDAGLVVFAREQADEAVAALCELSVKGRSLGAETGFDTHLRVNAHVGRVVAGSFGPPGLERYDVIGKAVNVAARLGRRGVTLSAEAFRSLSAEARARFAKQTQPVTYRWRGPA